MKSPQLKKGFTIRPVSYGIANRFPGKRIEYHKKLLQDKYKPLLYEILDHEMSHTDSGYSSHDLWLDVRGFRNKALYHSFILRTPSAWVQYSPLYKSEGRWYTDISLIIFWGIMFATMGVLGWLFTI